MPYRFLEHIATADVAFEAVGADREELFAACAEALLATMVHDPDDVRPAMEVEFRLEEGELDLLLYAFLDELVFRKDAHRMLLRPRQLRIVDAGSMLRLDAVLAGEMLEPARHRPVVDVKAVTLHRFEVVFTETGWQATVVLDV